MTTGSKISNSGGELIRRDSALSTTTVLGAPVPMDYGTVLELGKAFAASGMWQEATDPGVAAVKIIAGSELGLTPVAAMNGIDIIPGRQGRGPRMRPNADVQALLAARAGFTYRPLEHDDTHCILEWFENGVSIGTSEFTVAAARKAGLVRDGGAWNAWGMNMSLARAVTQGVKLYCRHVLAGRVGGMLIVTTEELEDEYPDPRDDIMRALFATYRERFPKAQDMSAELYRQFRLNWSESVLGTPVPSWNGPESPETLTRADVNRLQSALEEVVAAEIEDEEDTETASVRSQDPEAVAGPGRSGEGPADSSAGARQGDARRPDSGYSIGSGAPAEPHSAGHEPASAAAPGQIRQVGPAEYNVAAETTGAPVGTSRKAAAATRDVPGAAAAPARPKRGRPAKPDLKEAARQATAERRQTEVVHKPSRWLHTLPLKEKMEMIRAAAAWSTTPQIEVENVAARVGPLYGKSLEGWTDDMEWDAEQIECLQQEVEQEGQK